MDITKEFKYNKTITISDHDKERCSRNCYYCEKEDGIYYCLLEGEHEQIEGLNKEDIEISSDIPTEESYGFQRTERCISTFGIGYQNMSEGKFIECPQIGDTKILIEALEKIASVTDCSEDQALNCADYFNQTAREALFAYNGARINKIKKEKILDE